METQKEEVYMKRVRKSMICTLVLAMALSLSPALYADDSGKVNINQASVEQLAEIRFVGPKIAERIVEYRETNGPFGTLEDLMKVKGIGPSIFEKIKENITL
jgi:competence ComEA-like helix-hairpin-helix protein